MVNDLQELMRANVADPAPDHLDLQALVAAGRRRCRHRRAAALGPMVVAAGIVAAVVVSGPGGTERTGTVDRPPAPDAPTRTLADADQAVEGRDYRVLASYTNENLDSDNGQYFDGVTDDGLILFRDGPRADLRRPRLALMDPVTGAKDWLPDPALGQNTAWPVALGTDRLVMLTAEGGRAEGGGKLRLIAHVFDRGTRQWSSVTWPGLPHVESPGALMGPDGRLYVSVPATRGDIPEGGWPTGPDGEAEDADADGDTYSLWSVSLTDSSDVRDESLTVGSLAFTDSSMVWTDSTNGDAGLVHVRDLSSGESHTFDPHTGERCNLLAFGATDDRVVMSQYCGTYDGAVRDDRVQILTTDGDQVATIQASGIDGALAGFGATNDLVAVTAYEEGRAGTYVYDLGTDRFLRVSDAVSSWAHSGPAPSGQFLWDTPVNNRHGATQWLGQILPDE